MTNHRNATGSPALVLERWNTWVRVYLPDTRETRWVDLGKTGFAPLQPKSSTPRC